MVIALGGGAFGERFGQLGGDFTNGIIAFIKETMIPHVRPHFRALYLLIQGENEVVQRICHASSHSWDQLIK